MDSTEQTSSVAFGHAMKKFFSLDPDYVNLNHGSFGAVPLPVQNSYAATAARLEANPDKFLRLDWDTELKKAREAIAGFIGAPVEDCVFVSNVSTGIYTILLNIDWNEGDVLIFFNTTFESVVRGAKNLLTASPHPSISEIPIAFPTSHARILHDFRAHIQSVTAALGQSSKVVVILDSIASFPGVMMPWTQMVNVCKEEGVISLVDAAHSVGQEMDLNIQKVSPDYWISSCNKWLYSKRACAILYVSKRNQKTIRTAIPTDLLAPEDADFPSKFVWSGAMDAATIPTVQSALEFRRTVGGEQAIYQYCHNLAVAGGRRLAELLGTSVMESSEGDELTAFMVNVELPLSGKIKPSHGVVCEFHTKLLIAHRVYASQFYHNEKWWVRASAQIYNEIGDFEKLAVALEAVCKEIEDRFTYNKA